MGVVWLATNIVFPGQSIAREGVWQELLEVWLRPPVG